MTNEAELLAEATEKLEAFNRAKTELSEALQAVDNYVSQLTSLRAKIANTLDESKEESSSNEVSAEEEPAPAKPAPAKKAPAKKAAAKKTAAPAKKEEPAEEPVKQEEEEVDLFSDEPAEAKADKADTANDSSKEDEDYDSEFSDLEF